MLLYACIAIVVAVGLIQLGALSVWVAVLALTAKILALIVISAVLGVVGCILWRRAKNRINGVWINISRSKAGWSKRLEK